MLYTAVAIIFFILGIYIGVKKAKDFKEFDDFFREAIKHRKDNKQ